ncbi:MAG: ThuA domain-containing protein [Candidatus Promineifilaceae bacterium]
MSIRVTIFNEHIHERRDDYIASIYPQGIHGAIAEYLHEQPNVSSITICTLEQGPDHGLTQDVVDNTDVMIWWGHLAHDKVNDVVVERVYQRVHQGMGLIVLHSGHFSKIFKKLMGTSCGLRWRVADEKERLWVVDPSHPITQGIGPFIELESAEMYGEQFDIPNPDALLFISWFEGGNVFRSGATWRRGRGKVFYFRPGHETYPVFYNPEIRQVLGNAVKWVKFQGNTAVPDVSQGLHQPQSLELIK